jgi:hypothetical protein
MNLASRSTDDKNVQSVLLVLYGRLGQEFDPLIKEFDPLIKEFDPLNKRINTRPRNRCPLQSILLQQGIIITGIMLSLAQLIHDLHAVNE